MDCQNNFIFYLKFSIETKAKSVMQESRNIGHVKTSKRLVRIRDLTNWKFIKFEFSILHEHIFKMSTVTFFCCFKKIFDRQGPSVSRICFESIRIKTEIYYKMRSKCTTDESMVGGSVVKVRDGEDFAVIQFNWLVD